MIDTLPRAVFMSSLTIPPTTSLSISTSALTNSGILSFVPYPSESSLSSTTHNNNHHHSNSNNMNANCNIINNNNNSNGNNTPHPQNISSFSGCPNCFVIDNELIYRCDECVRREELQREEQENASPARGSDPLSSPQTDVQSSLRRQIVEIKTERMSDDEQTPSTTEYEDYRESFPSKRPRRTPNLLNFETTLTNPHMVNMINSNNNNNNNNSHSNSNNNTAAYMINNNTPFISSNNNSNISNINPLKIKQETAPPFIFPVHRRSNVSITYTSFEEQFQQTVSFARERGWDQMVDFLLSSLHKNMNSNNTSNNMNTQYTNTHAIINTTNSTNSSNNNSNNNNNNNNSNNNGLLSVANAVVGTMTSCPSSPSLPLIAPSSPSNSTVFPHFLSSPPSELLPGYYIYNKSIDSDTEQKEKVWIQIELPRDLVVDRDGRFLTVSMGMEMGPLPHDPNSFLELDSNHLQGTEGTLITETLTKCVYVFDKLRIPNRALISEVLNTEYQGLRAGRFVFKVGDRVLPNKSARFVIKAPSGNRIRSVNSKAKKSKKAQSLTPISTTLSSTRRGGNRNYSYSHEEDYDSDFHL